MLIIEKDKLLNKLHKKGNEMQRNFDISHIVYSTAIIGHPPHLPPPDLYTDIDYNYNAEIVNIV